MRSKADWAKVKAATEAEIRRQAIEDGHPVMTARMLKEARVVAPEDVDVKAIRQRQRLSQAAFARKYGFSTRTVQEWEQRRARPDRATRILLAIIDREPATVERALRSVS
ncbi:MAG TPA: helix-turn-helix domain-containing protein [Alphaproteobacteria bacterium]|nr:helix-turn-helix domain-containing protein [Alphaproteobacteria bacterium]